MESPCRCGVEHGSRPAPISTGRRAHPEKIPTRGRADYWRPDIAYAYRDGDGHLLFEVCRTGNGPGKDIKQRQPDPAGGYWADLDGVERVLYRLPELLAADPDAQVFITAGEKDCDRLRSLGLTATTNPGGEGKDKWLPAFTPHLAGHPVVVLVDNDATGIAHGEAVARALFGTAERIQVIRLPGLPEGGDVSDWLDTDHTITDLLQLVAVWPPWHPETPLSGPCADERAEVLRLRGELDQLRAELERQRDHAWTRFNESDRRLRAFAGAVRNKALPASGRAVATAVAKHLYGADIDGTTRQDGWVHVNLEQLAVTAGVGRATASRYVQEFARAGILDRDLKKERSDRTASGFASTLLLRPRTGDGPAGFLDAFTDYTPPDAKQRGGWRPRRCPNGCQAPIVERLTTQHVCSGCGEVLDETSTTRTLASEDPEPAPLHVVTGVKSQNEIPQNLRTLGAQNAISLGPPEAPGVKSQNETSPGQPIGRCAQGHPVWDGHPCAFCPPQAVQA
jgi:hypothetical protein